MPPFFTPESPNLKVFQVVVCLAFVRQHLRHADRATTVGPVQRDRVRQVLVLLCCMPALRRRCIVGAVGVLGWQRYRCDCVLRDERIEIGPGFPGVQQCQ